MSYGAIVVLHPWHKLRYFEKVGWEPEWIATARGIIRTEFDHSYASAQPESEELEDQGQDIEIS